MSRVRMPERRPGRGLREVGSEYLLPTVRDVLAGLRHIELVDRSMVLSAQALLAVVPL